MQVSVLCNEPKFQQLTIVFSAFYKLFLETTSFSTTPIGQIIPCHNVTIFWLITSRLYWSLISPSFRNSSKYLAKKCWREVSRYKNRHSYEKDYGKHLTSQKQRGEFRLDVGRRGAVVLLCKELPRFQEIFLFIREMNEPVMAIRGKTFHNYW